MNTKVDKQASFIEELCKYYMTFLQSGFKSTRFPKRYIRFKNEKNFKIGVDLRKYEKFNTYLRKLIHKDTNFQNPINVKKGEFSVKLDNTAQDLIKKLVKKISDKDIEKIVNLATKVIKEYSVTYKKKPDEAYDKIINEIKKDLQEIIIKPITEKMEPMIGSQSGNFQLDSLFTLEMGLAEVILDPLVEGIPAIFNDILADKKNKPKEEISKLFNRKDISVSLLQYFQNFDVKDFYYELQDIVNSKKNLDKKEIYLYFSELEIEKKRFPLFYTQINIQEFSKESRFQITFSNEIFVNKRAIQYAFDVLKKEERRVETFNEERKIYMSQEENLSKRLYDIINSIVPKLRIEGSFDLESTSLQIFKSINFVISNNCSICVFDKSDEALINDFEDILGKLLSGENSEIVEMFKNIINDFLLNEPEVITEELDDTWHEMGLNDRLNYRSPIPLNAEQYKILKALKKENCKYVVVEGPPGTGKSHTISAIAFDYILDDKSILILSDTREALDVVENKINDTLNKVRGKNILQNPILRLGKMGNTYNKILAKSSIDNIRVFHRAQKNNIGAIDKDIKDISDVINDRIKIETDHYKYIDKDKFEDFFEVQKEVTQEDLFINIQSLKENLQKLDLTHEDLNLNGFIDQISSIEEAEELTESFKDIYKKDRKNLNNFVNFTNQISLIDQFIKKYQSSNEIKNIFFFEKVDHSKLLKLEKLIEKFTELKAGLFGGFFKGGAFVELSDDVKKLMGIKKNLNLKNDIEKVIETNYLYKDLEKLCKKEGSKINFNEICKIIDESKSLSKLNDLCKINEKYFNLFQLFLSDNKNLINLEINPEQIDSIYENKLSEYPMEKIQYIKKYYEMEEFFSNSFNVKDRFDYTTLMQKLQSLYTSHMTNILDDRVIKFYDKNKATAKTLSTIIRGKQKFPKKDFEKLKVAFPCIISSVRDFAEYIQLEKGLFDLIIIDEASQVSIAQAFPALIRAKKILVLGDKKQFSNLQSYQATSEVNTSYVNEIRKVFKKNISAESDTLVRLEAFNVKTSILDFFQNIANLDTRLKKHTRGYPEHIAYCSKTFYNNDLQAIRLRSKPINEVIKFEQLDYSADDLDNNINKKEAEVIIKHLEKLKEKNINQTVGIITPFTDQQKYITTQITKHPDKDYFFDPNKLKLKIMTFDTCQGEERQIIFYSMVACKKRNKLWSIFPKDLTNTDIEDLKDKKAQRLNVGFSRVQETMHIIHSRPLDQIDGEIGNALRFIKNLSSEEKLASEKDVDPKSPMEKKVIGWFRKTSFYLENKKNIELKAQFPIGEYLRQLDPDYGHPKFVTDFLVNYSNDQESKQVIIEYDGLKDHFDNQELITDENFDEFYTNDHYEREKALETYGYKFIRLNKFNIQPDPVKFLDKKLRDTFSKKDRLNLSQYKILETVQKTKEGEKKYCDRCKKLKDLDDFKDKSLRSGIGLVCGSCKGISGTSRRKRRSSGGSDFKKSNVKFKWQVGKKYKISYENATGWASEREITIKEIETKLLKAYDSITLEQRSFRKDRIKKSVQI